MYAGLISILVMELLALNNLLSLIGLTNELMLLNPSLTYRNFQC